MGGVQLTVIICENELNLKLRTMPFNHPMSLMPCEQRVAELKRHFVMICSNLHALMTFFNTRN